MDFIDSTIENHKAPTFPRLYQFYEETIDDHTVGIMRDKNRTFSLNRKWYTCMKS